LERSAVLQSVGGFFQRFFLISFILVLCCIFFVIADLFHDYSCILTKLNPQNSGRHGATARPAEAKPGGVIQP
jgi:hypothetical protein